MAIFYSPSLGGFYDEDLHGPRFITIADPNAAQLFDENGEPLPVDTVSVANPDTRIPLDAREISPADYESLLAAQSVGKQITADEDGNPIATSPVVDEAAQQRAEIVAQILAFEAKQPRAIREATLNIAGGRQRLEAIESAIVALRAQL